MVITKRTKAPFTKINDLSTTRGHHSPSFSIRSHHPPSSARLSQPDPPAPTRRTGFPW